MAKRVGIEFGEGTGWVVPATAKLGWSLVYSYSALVIFAFTYTFLILQYPRQLAQNQ